MQSGRSKRCSEFGRGTPHASRRVLALLSRAPIPLFPLRLKKILKRIGALILWTLEEILKGKRKTVRKVHECAEIGVAWSCKPSARKTLSTVANSGLPSGDNAL